MIAKAAVDFILITAISNREISYAQANAIRNDCQRIFDKRWNDEHGNAFEDWNLAMTVDGIIDWMADFTEIMWDDDYDRPPLTGPLRMLVH